MEGIHPVESRGIPARPAAHPPESTNHADPIIRQIMVQTARRILPE